MIFLHPKAIKKSKKVSILENDRRDFVTLSDHCALLWLHNNFKVCFLRFFTIQKQSYNQEIRSLRTIVPFLHEDPKSNCSIQNWRFLKECIQQHPLNRKSCITSICNPFCLVICVNIFISLPVKTVTFLYVTSLRMSDASHPRVHQS